MKKLYFILAFIFISSTFLGQHSTLTSNYLFNLFAVNPAYAGQKRALDMSFFYRKQWGNLTGAPQTLNILSSIEVKPKNLSLGIQYQNDKIGLTSTSNAKLAIAYRVKLDRKKTISFGIMPGYRRIFYDLSKLRTTSQGDEVLNFNSPVINSFNASAGIFYYTKKIYGGISSPELFNVNKTFSFTEFNIIGGYVIKASDEVTLKPSFLLRHIKNSPTQVDINLTAYINVDLGIGIAYRNKDAIVGYLDYLINKKFRIGYSYDYSVGKLRKYNSGSHEIMLNYFFGKTSHAPSPRFF